MIAALGLLAAFVTFQPPADAPQVNLPLGVIGQVAANGWQVVHTQQIVKGTENFRAQIFDRVFYCGKLGDPKGRVLWEEKFVSSTHFDPLHLRPDGTVLAVAYPDRFLVLGPNDPPAKRGDGVQFFLPDAKRPLRIIEVGSHGLLACPDIYHNTGKIYFVPLEGAKPLFDKRVEITERAMQSISRYRSGFHLSDDWIFYDLSAFNSRTGKRWALPLSAKETTFLGLEGSLVVVLHKVVVNSKYVAKAVVFDLATEKQVAEFPVEVETIMPVVHRGVGYFFTPIPLKVGERDSKAEMVAYDLTKPGEPLHRKVVPHSLANAPSRPSRTRLASRKTMAQSGRPVTMSPAATMPRPKPAKVT